MIDVVKVNVDKVVNDVINLGVIVFSLKNSVDNLNVVIYLIVVKDIVNLGINVCVIGVVDGVIGVDSVDVVNGK